MKVNKNGTIITSNIVDTIGADILENSAQFNTPYAVTGTGGDIIVTTDAYCAVTPGETYYLLATCLPAWSPSHCEVTSIGKGTIWLYLLKTFDSTNYGYDNLKLFTSSNWIREGVWKYTIPEGYHMARIRLNTYSDGVNAVTVKYSDIHLIPEKYFVDGKVSSIKFGDNYIACNDIIEY